VSDVIIAASVSFCAAVIAVVIGQVLAGRFQSATEERRWQREDAARWRIRSEQMAREAIDRLAVATDFVGWNGGKERALQLGLEEHEWVQPDIGEVSALIRPVRRAGLEIDHADIREHLTKGTELLVNGYAARDFGAAYLPRLAWAVQTTSEVLIGAYLRGSRFRVALMATMRYVRTGACSISPIRQWRSCNKCMSGRPSPAGGCDLWSFGKGPPSHCSFASFERRCGRLPPQKT
jgi:hypothetical protein